MLHPPNVPVPNRSPGLDCQSRQLIPDLLACRTRVAPCLGEVAPTAAMDLLFADTLPPNMTPLSVHEVRFDRPCIIKAFRVVCEGECPHPEISFEGRTPPTALAIELYGSKHGPGVSLCTALLSEPHRRQNLNSPSVIHAIAESAASMPIDYLVIRFVARSSRARPCRRADHHGA